MSGYLDHNFPAFHEAAKHWREKGHVVFNPAEQHNGDTSLPVEVYLRNDFSMILQVESLALLPGWHNSRYGKVEVQMAQGLGLMFFDAITFEAIAPVVTTYAEPVRQAA